jgi:hypothetical protein
LRGSRLFEPGGARPWDAQDYPPQSGDRVRDLAYCWRYYAMALSFERTPGLTQRPDREHLGVLAWAKLEQLDDQVAVVDLMA